MMLAVFLQMERIESLSRAFRPADNADETARVLILTIAMIGIVTALFVSGHWLMHRTKWGTGIMLFISLCRAHRLTWQESHLLWQVANRAKLTSPSLVFTLQTPLRTALKSETLAPRRDAMRTLGKRLFKPREKPEITPTSCAGDEAIQVTESRAAINEIANLSETLAALDMPADLSASSNAAPPITSNMPIEPTDEERQSIAAIWDELALEAIEKPPGPSKDASKTDAALPKDRRHETARG